MSKARPQYQQADQAVNSGQAPLDIDFFARDLLVNPYPTYRLLRETAPAYWSEQLQSWVLTRYDDVLNALNRHDIFSSERTQRIVRSYIDRKIKNWPIRTPLRPFLYRIAELKMAPFMQLAENFMWQQDPPNHTRLRKLMHTGFTMQMVKRQEKNIQEKVNHLLDQAKARPDVDFMRDFAMQLPAMIVADIFGMPDEWQRLRHWEDNLKLFLGGSSKNPKETQRLMLDSIDEMKTHFGKAIAERRKNPGDDLISILAQAEDSGYYFDDFELCANLIVTLGAAQVTTQDMLGNGLLALLQAPEQLALFKAPDAPLADYIDELVRFDGPVQLTHRILTEDLNVHGAHMRAGELVYVIRGAANRDPTRFTEPDQLNVLRDTKGHVAFGYGIHYCIGAALARAEGVISFRTLFSRFPDIRLNTEQPVVWRGDSLQFRGLASLPVVLH